MPIETLAIQPGLLRHSITIQAPSTTRDAYGQPSSTWTNVLTTRAKRDSTITATYKEAASQNTLTSQASYIFTIRWPGSTIKITPDMRILFDGQNYQINALNNVLGRNRFLQILAMVIDGTSN